MIVWGPFLTLLLTNKLNIVMGYENNLKKQEEKQKPWSKKRKGKKSAQSRKRI